jgi:polyhydroxyalkanoate synthesis regulator phasin
MIKLGDYSEEEAKKLISDLRKAGIKNDTRSHFKITHFRTDSLEGRLSQLKGVLKSTRKIERTLKILKSALAQSHEPDKFKELFFK